MATSLSLIERAEAQLQFNCLTHQLVADLLAEVKRLSSVSVTTAEAATAGVEWGSGLDASDPDVLDADEAQARSFAAMGFKQRSRVNDGPWTQVHYAV